MAELSDVSDFSDEEFQPKKPRSGKKPSSNVLKNNDSYGPAPSSSKQDFKCKFCSLKFTSSKNIARHAHVCKKNPSKLSPKFVCDQCSQTFTRSDHLRAHKIKPCDSAEHHKARSKCMYPECQEIFFHKTALIEHIKLNHISESNESHDPVRISFPSLQDFVTWKEAEQEKNFSYFSMQSGESKKKKSTLYLYCQHDGSGKVHLRDGETRKTKRSRLGGGIKRGCLCLAHMKVKRIGDGISVDYYPFHTHKIDPADFRHQPLSKATYELIDQQLAWDVAPSAIKKLLEDGTFHRENRDGDTEFKRNHFVSEKLIRERKRRVRNAKRHDKDDAMSVNLLYQELKQENYSPVLIYKPVGAKVVEGPSEARSLPADDLFMFGIQTKAQAELFQKGASKAVLVDETHGTNQYDYQLLTVMVPDDNNRCWPVAHLISSRSDADTIKYFFLALKKKFPSQTINCVMTDDTTIFINAMESAYERPLRHLLCLWHLHQTFQRNIPKKSSPDFHTELYNDLKAIIGCHDVSTFDSLCKAFSIKYANTAPAFLEYLQKNYFPQDRAMKWAMCFRNFYHANIETTGPLESFHSRLKKKYMKRRVNKRVDDLIHMLLLIEEDDYATRKRESVFGLAGTSADAVLLRHNKAMNMSNDLIEVFLPSTAYFIKSSKNPDTIKYHICVSDFKCFKKLCRDTCTESQCCGLCAHMYRCSCPDKSPLCKHIHKLHSFLVNSGLIPASAIASVSQDDDDNVHFFCNTNPWQEPAIGEKCKENRLKSLNENLDKLRGYSESGEIPDNLLAHADVTVKELLKKIESIQAKNLPSLEEMVPTCTFASTQKLEKQILPQFKRPPAKKKKSTGFNQKLSVAAKEEVKENLLAILAENDVDEPSSFSANTQCDSIPGLTSLEPLSEEVLLTALDRPSTDKMCEGNSSFTPHMDYTKKPYDTVLNIGSESVSLIHLKGLEENLPPDQVQNLKTANSSFKVGYLNDVIVNAFFLVLNDAYTDSIALHSDFGSGLLLGRSVNLKRASGKKAVVFPCLVDGNHWILIAFRLETSEIFYFDSLYHEIPKHRMKLLSDATSAIQQICDIKNWTVKIMRHDKQQDSINCGVHMCLFGHQLMAGMDNFNPLTDSAEYRQFIFNILVGGCLRRTSNEDNLGCGVCGNDTVNSAAVACSKCDQWYHQECVLNQDDSSPFVCPSP